MTIHWKAVKQYFSVVLFVFQFYLVCNFGKLFTLNLNLALPGVKGLSITHVQEFYLSQRKVRTMIIRSV